MIGSKLQDRYELEQQLGRGGMGVVYRAWDPVLHRDVAIKTIPPLHLNRETEERFQREAQLVAGMDHPAIVAIHDFGRHEGSLFFVMPLVEGTLLQDLIDQGTLLLEEILDIGIQVAEALDYSHSRGVVHRDVKPGNIMISREGRGQRARVMDFGLARGAAERRITRSGGLIGTLANLSPEQITTGSIDPRSDIYALGTVLYEALAGKPPFSGAVHSVLYRIVHEAPPSLKRILSDGPEYDDDLTSLVDRCLAKDPAQRPQHGSELATALGDIGERLDDSQRLMTLGPSSRPVALEPTRPIASPLVGRQTEWAELQSRLSSALVGECQFVLVEGDAGTGKSRLLIELENLAHSRRIQVLRGRFVDHESAIPYQGLCELIQDYFRQHEPSSSSGSNQSAADPTRSSRSQLATADFSDLAGDLVRFFPVLSEVRDLQPEGDGATESHGGRPLARHQASDPTRLYELLARALARIGGGKALVLLIENLHEGEVSLAALSYIARRLGPTPTLLVGTCRRGEVEPGHPLLRMLKSFQDDPRFSSICLESLAPDDFNRLVELQLGSGTLRGDLLTRLYEATEGNPHFGQELVRWLLETEGLARDDSGCWTLATEAGFITEALPATIQQAVERRIERLPSPLRHLLSLASVLGKNFTYEDLQALVALDADDFGNLDEAIDQLAEAGILEEDTKSRDDRLHFSRGVVREILYQELSRRKRRSLHRRYAAKLVVRYADRLDRVYPQLVHHFSAGDEAESTIEYALLLARKSLAAFSPDDTVRAVRTALDFVDDAPATMKGELFELLAAAYRAQGSTDKAVREAERAADAYEQAGLSAAAAAAALLAAETAWQARRVEAARPWVDRGIELAGRAEATETLHRLLTLGATVANLRGEHQQARRYFEEAERLKPSEPAEANGTAPPMGGTLRAVLPYPIGSLDPVALRTDEEFEVAANIFETLLDSDPDGNLKPSLCEAWESSNSGRTFELTLRRDVHFSDGCPFGAGDVQAAVERMKKSSSVFRGPGFAAIRAVEILEEPGSAKPGQGDRIRFHLVRSLPIFPALLTDASTAIVRATQTPDGDPRLVGTGPFRLVESTPEQVLLERNPNYWRGTPAPLDRIELHTSLNAAGIAEGLRSGELDLGRDLMPTDLESIQRETHFRDGLVEVTKKNVYFVLLNQAGPQTCQRQLRRALVSMVRIQELIWRTLGRFAQPAVCLLPPGILGHDSGRRRATTTAEQATEWLEQAGVQQPIRLQAAIHPLFRDRYKALLTALFGEWAKLGVEVVDRTLSMDQYLTYWSGKSDVDLLIGRWNADFDDPDTFTHGLFHSREGRLRAFYNSPETDRLLENARQENQTARRLGHYHRFEDLLAEDHILLPLFHDIDYRIAGPHLRRLRLEARAPYVNYAHLAKHKEAHPTPPIRRRLADSGELHVALPTAFASLDPAADNFGEHFEPKANVFETLTRLVEGARVMPWLAAFFEVPGGGSYHFHLREKIRFHDGRRLTARDVRYSFERRLKNPDCLLHLLLLPIRGAQALRDGEAADLKGFRILSAEKFVIELEHPLSFFPALLSHPGLGISPEGMENFTASWREGSIGTGAFRVVRFDAREGVDLERNPQYWHPGSPKTRRLQFHFNVAAKNAISEFRAGRLSLVGRLLPNDLEALRRDPVFAGGYHESPRLSTAFLALNSRRGPFADPELRRQLVEVLDVESLIRDTVATGVIRADGILPPGLLGYEVRRPQARAPSISSHDFSGVEITLAAHPSFLSQYSTFWKELRQVFLDLGLRVRLIEDHLAAIMQGQSNEADLVAGRWIADYPDADAFTVGLLHSREGALSSMLGSPEIDAKIQQGQRETDPTLRHSIYREIEEILARDHLIMPLFHEQNYRFVHPTVRGLQLGLATPEVRYEDLYVVR